MYIATCKMCRMHARYYLHACIPESQDGTDSLSIRWSYSDGSEHHGKIDLALLRKNRYSLAAIKERQQSSMPKATVSSTSTSKLLSLDYYEWQILWFVPGVPTGTSFHELCLPAKGSDQPVSPVERWYEFI